MSPDENGKISTVIKGNRLCIKYIVTDFYPTETLPKLKGHKAFILRPGTTYCKIRLCSRWSGENTEAVLQLIWKHLSLKSCII